jgi:hypothetical protein
MPRRWGMSGGSIEGGVMDAFELSRLRDGGALFAGQTPLGYCGAML